MVPATLRLAAGVLLLALAVDGSAAVSRFAEELDAQWDYARPAVSEQRFRTVMASWPSDTPQALEVLTQVARAQGLQRRFADAHATLDHVAARLDGMPSHLRVRYLLERGRVFNSNNVAQQAVPLFRLALELAECNGEEFYAIDAAHMLGIAAAKAERQEWNMKAIAMAERADDPRARRWLAPLYNNAGWTYMDAGDAARALEYFRKALPAWEARGGIDDIRFARWAVARALRATGDLAGAQDIQRALLAEHERDGSTDGYVFEELAELALAQGDRDGARSWFAKAWSALREHPAMAAEPERLRRMAELGGLAAPTPLAPPR